MIPAHIRVLQKVELDRENQCWLFRGGLNQGGYGRVHVLGENGRPRRQTVPHRVTYEFFIGPIPDGLTLDHFRLNPGPRKAPCSKACVNPWHLEAVTHKENTLRGGSVSALNARQTCCSVCGGPYVFFLRSHGLERRCRRCQDRHRDAYRARMRAAKATVKTEAK